MITPRDIPANVAAALPTAWSRPVRRANHACRIGTIKLPRNWRLIVDMDTRKLLEACSHERYNRVLDAWCARYL